MKILAVNLCFILTVVASQDESILTLVNWIHENGGFISEFISVRESLNLTGRGVFANKHIAQNATIARIPLKVMINIEHAIISELNEANVLDPLNDVDALAIFLCFEEKKGVSSFWYPFLQSWPKRFDTFPLFLTEQQLSEIKTVNADFYNETVRLSITVKERYNQLNQKDCSLEDFKKFISIVKSRIFSVQIFARNKWHKSFALVPYGDLFNTGMNTNADCATDKSSTHLECFATTSISRSSEILMPYMVQKHESDNFLFWLEYGFTLESEEPTGKALHDLWLSLNAEGNGKECYN